MENEQGFGSWNYPLTRKHDRSAGEGPCIEVHSVQGTQQVGTGDRRHVGTAPSGILPSARFRQVILVQGMSRW